MCRFSVERQREINFLLPVHTGFALAVIRPRKQEEQSREECERESRIEFPFQSCVRANYNKGIR